MVVAMHFLAHICIMFLNGLPTVNWSCVIHQNRVLREVRGQGDGIVVVPRLVNFFTERTKLLLNSYSRVMTDFRLPR